MDKTYNRNEIIEKLNLSHREHFRSAYLQPALEPGFFGDDHSRKTKE